MTMLPLSLLVQVQLWEVVSWDRCENGRAHRMIEVRPKIKPIVRPTPAK